ncbi:DNA polymerase III subunit epsilon [Acetobacter malorum DSM 14337]|uniref:DNA-directed DNA polymerase n=1 Tax=Acetobacter malorum DSM 14337 TaxID=1307910 RepID=A0ABQ0Q0J9_9PROT|nr:hypothetical protein AD930_02355 [Acetobacter malorum]GBQ86194.1 DNA polymerase III subunit epsilon [Acetobacter malorum DSM 14337]
MNRVGSVSPSGRELITDTETTGLSADDRVIELAMIELQDKIPTGRTLHMYFNPGRPVPEAATRIHHITDEFLADKPTFGSQLPAILAFAGASPIVAHNALFDKGKMNYEMELLNHEAFQNEFIDTLKIAQEKYRNADNSLNGLCRRFGISLEKRDREGHNALLDCQLLAQCYEELTVGRNKKLKLVQHTSTEASHITQTASNIARRNLREDRGIGRPSTSEIQTWQSYRKKTGLPELSL